MRRINTQTTRMDARQTHSRKTSQIGNKACKTNKQRDDAQPLIYSISETRRCQTHQKKGPTKPTQMHTKYTTPLTDSHRHMISTTAAVALLSLSLSNPVCCCFCRGERFLYVAQDIFGSLACWSHSPTERERHRQRDKHAHQPAIAEK